MHASCFIRHLNEGATFPPDTRGKDSGTDGAREMAHRFRVYTALPEDVSSDSSTPVGWLKATWTSSCRESDPSDASVGPVHKCTMPAPPTHTK